MKASGNVDRLESHEQSVISVFTVSIGESCGRSAGLSGSIIIAFDDTMTCYGLTGFFIASRFFIFTHCHKINGNRQIQLSQFV